MTTEIWDMLYSIRPFLQVVAFNTGVVLGMALGLFPYLVIVWVLLYGTYASIRDIVRYIKHRRER